jgi:hypothetical protein
MVTRSSRLSFFRYNTVLLRRVKWKFQSVRRRVFSGFWTKRVACRARDSLFIHLDSIN